MKAGRLTSKLRVMRPDPTTNQYGEESTEWEDAGTVWAERRRLTGNRSEEVGEHFADYRAEFNVRSAHHIEEGWRVEHLGGKLYEVTNVIPNTARDYQTLVCERVNE